MVIRRVGVLSVGMLLGVLYALFGLVIGLMFTLISLLGAAGSMLASGAQDAGLGVGVAGGAMSLLFGGLAIVAFPIVYGLLGFLGGLLSALFYNLAAKLTGGIAIETE